MPNMSRIRSAALLAILAGAHAELAGSVENITPLEQAMLPPHCQQQNIFHYCGSLIKLMRAERAAPNSRARRTVALSAVNSFQYSLRYMENERPRYRWLLPEAYMNLGKAHFLAGDSEQAIAAMKTALGVRPDYERGYAAMIDLYIKKGMREEARKVAATGLEQIPASRGLQTWYIELGGKLPLPAIGTQAEGRAAPQAAEAGAAGDAPAVAVEQPVPPDGAVAPAAGEAEAPPKKARSCRFCP